MTDQPQVRSILEDGMTTEQLDAGKRASDLINLNLTLLGWDALKSCCMAIRLSDGGSDGVVYDNREDAIAHQLHENQCYYVYFRNLPGGANPREMAIVLEFQRRAYAAGMRLVDPDNPGGARELLVTTNWYDSMKDELGRRGLARRMSR